jgi:hypothetical protein
MEQSRYLLCRLLMPSYVFLPLAAVLVVRLQS